MISSVYLERNYLSFCDHRNKCLLFSSIMAFSQTEGDVSFQLKIMPATWLELLERKKNLQQFRRLFDVTNDKRKWSSFPRLSERNWQIPLHGIKWFQPFLIKSPFLLCNWFVFLFSRLLIKSIFKIFVFSVIKNICTSARKLTILHIMLLQALNHNIQLAWS